MINVLLADDHPIVLKGMRRAISETMDIAVCGEAQSGGEALSLLRAKPPDVLVLDLTMPGTGGLEVLQTLRVEQPALPVLILSMHPEEQYATRMLRAGAAGYLTKAEAPRKIIGAIRQVAQGRKYVSAHVAQELAARAARAGHLPSQKSPHERLSEREFQVMLRLSRGHSACKIAGALSLSESTVRTYRQRIFEKIGLQNSVELSRYATREGLLK